MECVGNHGFGVERWTVPTPVSIGGCCRRAGMLVAELVGAFDTVDGVAFSEAFHGEPTTMLVVHVHVHVKDGLEDAFRAATIENARNSLQEPGVARFDVLQQQDDPTKFILVEAYRTADDPARHKATAHYAKWRDTVEPMMAEPRKNVKFSNCFPEDYAY